MAVIAAGPLLDVEETFEGFDNLLPFGARWTSSSFDTIWPVSDHSDLIRHLA
jgi:hypothetical protein